MSVFRVPMISIGRADKRRLTCHSLVRDLCELGSGWAVLFYLNCFGFVRCSFSLSSKVLDVEISVLALYNARPLFPLILYNLRISTFYSCLIPGSPTFSVLFIFCWLRYYLLIYHRSVRSYYRVLEMVALSSSGHMCGRASMAWTT